MEFDKQKVVSEINKLITHSSDPKQSMDTATWRRAVRAGLSLALLVIEKDETLETILATRKSLLDG